MAKLAAIRIGRTFNTGNYESHRVDVEIQLEPEDTVDSALEDANALVDYIAHGGPKDCQVEAAQKVLNYSKRVRKFR